VIDRLLPLLLIMFSVIQRTHRQAAHAAGDGTMVADMTARGQALTSFSDQTALTVMTAACTGAGRAGPTRWGYHWMRCLAAGFHVVYPPEDVLCYDPDKPGHMPVVIGSVRKKEMIFDLLVAGWEQNAIPATTSSAAYPRLKRAVWAVESEVDIGAADVLFDFNKLLLSSVPNRLMIPRSRDCNRTFSDMLRVGAAAYTDDRGIHVAYIPRFNESPTNSTLAAAEWLVANGNVPFALYVIGAAGVRCLQDPFV
jgi:hypothetical protein